MPEDLLSVHASTCFGSGCPILAGLVHARVGPSFLLSPLPAGAPDAGVASGDFDSSLCCFVTVLSQCSGVPHPCGFGSCKGGSFFFSFSSPGGWSTEFRRGAAPFGFQGCGC